jgi:hypothetical protein
VGGRPTATRCSLTPTPITQKAREGRKKHRLILDPTRAPIVAMIFADYTENGPGLSAICEKLNRDLDRFPPLPPTARTGASFGHADRRSARPGRLYVPRGRVRNPATFGFHKTVRL